MFDGTLPNVLITLNRHPKSKGYFSPDRFEQRDRVLPFPLIFLNNNNSEAKTHELALNPDSFANRTDEEILSTLVHEMTHLWQQTHGKPSRSGYHNMEWANKMESIGLIPSHSGEADGKKTGQKITHYIKDGGSYQVAYKKLQATAFLLRWQSPIETTMKKPTMKRDSKTKFTCPECQQNAWAKPDARVMCGVCYAADEETINFMIPEGGFEIPKAMAAGAAVGGDFDGWLMQA